MVGISCFIDTSLFYVSPINSAIFSFPEIFRCNPRRVKLFLLKLVCFTLSAAFIILCNYLLNTSAYLFTHHVTCRSCPWEAVTIIMFIFCMVFINFLTCLKPIFASFWLSLEPPPYDHYHLFQICLYPLFQHHCSALRGGMSTRKYTLLAETLLYMSDLSACHCH
jgi:hypothetical protein